MRKLVLARLLQLVIVVVVMTAIAFVVLRLLPGNPARAILGSHATRSAVAAEDRRLGLDHPIAVQYLKWLVGFLHGNLGQTFQGGSVTHRVLQAAPVSVELALGALVLGVLGGIVVAMISVRKPGGIVDSLLTIYSVIAASVPSFVWGLLLVLVGSLTLRLLPASGYVSPLSNPVTGMKSLVMPVIALSLPTVGNIARVARASLVENLAQPYVTYARTKGLPERRIRAVHALRNSWVAIAAVAGATLGYILGDIVAVEYVFSLPGLGALIMTAFLSRTYPLIQGGVIVVAIIVVLGNLLADVVALGVDPRLRVSASSVARRVQHEKPRMLWQVHRG